MIKKFLLTSAVSLLLFGCGSVQNTVTSRDEPSQSSAANSSVKTVKDASPAPAAIINLAPDVREEMLNADYWLKNVKNPDKVLMTGDEIQLWNKNVSVSLLPGTNGYYLISDLRKAPSSIPADQIRRTMCSYNPSVPWFKKLKNGKIHTLNDKDWKIFWQEMNLEQLAPWREWINQKWIPMKANKKEFPVTKAVTIRRSNLRVVPEDNFYSDDKDFWYDDAAQNSGILMNCPVLILWKSADKKWYYVQTEYCTGWIHADDVATCTDEQFERYFDWAETSKGQFITVVCDRLQLSDDSFTRINGVYRNKPQLFMGTNLHIQGWTQEVQDKFSPRIPFACYLAEIPFRKTDGTLGILYGAIPYSAAVKGYLPYTTSNILKLAFQSLGIRYGWGGMEEARDCSEYLKDIHRCFGFNFPRNSRAQMAMPGKAFDTGSKKLSEKKKILDSLDPGTVLGFSGHVFMYLGKENGKYYTISALGSYYPDDFYEEKTDACSVNVNTLDVKRKTGRSWLENLSGIKLLINDGSLYNPQISLDPKYKFAELSKINTGSAVLYKSPEKDHKNITVAINAGHGTKGGSSVKTFSHPDKSPKVTGGTNPSGAVESIAVSDGMTFKSGKREKDVTLAVARIVKEELLKKGFDVLMIRDDADVQLDNIARTVIASNNADIHIAIHFDGDNSKTDKGIFWCSIPEQLKTLKNVKAHCKESERLGACMISAAKEEKLTVYKNGTMEVDLTQTSYSTIPTIDIELGNQCTSTDYATLEKRAAVVVKGILKYYEK